MRIVTLSRKPCAASSTTENVVKHQAGALNIDGTRIGTGDGSRQRENEESQDRRYTDKGSTNFAALPGPRGGGANGRWPANLVLMHRSTCKQVGTQIVPGYKINRWKDGAKPFGDGAGHEYESEEQPDEEMPVWECEETCSVRALGVQSGVTRSGAMKHVVGPYAGQSVTGFLRGSSGPHNQRDDEGTAARYFKQVQETMDSIPNELLDYLMVLIAPPPSCEPLIIMQFDLDDYPWEQHEDASVHGMITMGDPSPHMAEIDRVLRSGAHLLIVAADEDLTGAVGACAAEDFGYEIRDAIMICDTPGDLLYVGKPPPKERHAGVTPRERVREVERLFPREGIDLDELRLALEDFVSAKDLTKLDTSGVDPERVPDEVEGLELRTVRTRRVVRNDHPTIKGVAVMQSLLEDVPRGVVIDPFMGSGTTGVACLRTGHDFVGIDQDEEYLQIADERIRYWSRAHNPWGSADIESEAPPIENEAEPEGGVLDMFGGDP